MCSIHSRAHNIVGCSLGARRVNSRHTSETWKGDAAQLPNLDSSVHQLIDATVAVPSRLLPSPCPTSSCFTLAWQYQSRQNCSYSRCDESRCLLWPTDYQMVRLDNSRPTEYWMPVVECSCKFKIATSMILRFQAAESVSTQVSLGATVPERLPAAASLLKPYTTGLLPDLTPRRLFLSTTTKKIRHVV